MTLLITERDIRQLPLSVKEAIPIVEEVFRLQGEGTAETPPRFRKHFKSGGAMHFTPGLLHSKRVAGFKLFAGFEKSPPPGPGRGCNYLYSMDTSELLAIIHSYTISQFRTAAATAVAVKHLSAATASSVGIYGTGRQADGQLEAVCAVRPIKVAHAYSRKPEQREAFCRKMAQRLGIEVIAAKTPEQVAAESDIVVTVTNSEVPVLSGDWLTRPGLVVAAGANYWYKREIDAKVIARSKLIVVDEIEQAKIESGNLLWCVGHGNLDWHQVEELGNVVVGRVPMPDFKDATIFFGSHGLAITDMAMAQKTYELAVARGMGAKIDLG